MAGNLKMIGMVLAMVLAVSAAGAQGAWGHTFVTSPAPATVTAGQMTKHKFTTAVGSVECSSVTFTGTAAKNAEGSLTMTPHYTSCEFVEDPAEVTVNGCDYEFTGETTEEHAEIKLDCPTTTGTHKTHKIEVHVPSTGCTITLAEQESNDGVAYKNEGSGSTADVLITFTADFSIEADGPFFPCAFIGNTGTYTGTSTLTGETDGGSTHVGIKTIDGPVDSDFSFEAEETTLIGEDTGTEEFTLNAGTAKCTEAVYKGTAEGKTLTTITLAPEYGGCTAFGFSSASVDLNGCAYVFDGGEFDGELFEGEMDIECPEGKAIEIVAKVLELTKCTVIIEAQNDLTAVTYTNQGSGSTRDVKIDLSLTGIEYVQETGEGLGKCTSGTFENGKYNGTVTVIGENSKHERVGVWAEAT